MIQPTIYLIAPSSYLSHYLQKISNTSNGKRRDVAVPHLISLQSVEPALSVIVLKYIGVDRKE